MAEPSALRFMRAPAGDFGVAGAAGGALAGASAGAFLGPIGAGVGALVGGVLGGLGGGGGAPDPPNPIKIAKAAAVQAGFIPSGPKGLAILREAIIRGDPTAVSLFQQAGGRMTVDWVVKARKALGLPYQSEPVGWNPQGFAASSPSRTPTAVEVSAGLGALGPECDPRPLAVLAQLVQALQGAGLAPRY